MPPACSCSCAVRQAAQWPCRPSSSRPISASTPAADEHRSGVHHVLVVAPQCTKRPASPSTASVTACTSGAAGLPVAPRCAAQRSGRCTALRLACGRDRVGGLTAGITPARQPPRPRARPRTRASRLSRPPASPPPGRCRTRAGPKPNRSLDVKEGVSLSPCRRTSKRSGAVLGTSRRAPAAGQAPPTRGTGSQSVQPLPRRRGDRGHDAFQQLACQHRTRRCALGAACPRRDAAPGPALDLSTATITALGVGLGDGRSRGSPAPAGSPRARPPDGLERPARLGLPTARSAHPPPARPRRRRRAPANGAPYRSHPGSQAPAGLRGREGRDTEQGPDRLQGCRHAHPVIPPPGWPRGLAARRRTLVGQRPFGHRLVEGSKRAIIRSLSFSLGTDQTDRLPENSGSPVSTSGSPGGWRRGGPNRERWTCAAPHALSLVAPRVKAPGLTVNGTEPALIVRHGSTGAGEAGLERGRVALDVVLGKRPAALACREPRSACCARWPSLSSTRPCRIIVSPRGSAVVLLGEIVIELAHALVAVDRAGDLGQQRAPEGPGTARFPLPAGLVVRM